MTYELWKSGNNYSLIQESDNALHELLEPNAQRLMVIEAASLEDAQRMKHKFVGWEPYKPM